MQNNCYVWKGKTLCVRIFLQPGASRNRIIGIHNNALKVSLTSLPIAGQANQQLLEFLADEFGVTKKQISVVQGFKSRYKTISIEKPTRFPKELKILI